MPLLRKNAYWIFLLALSLVVAALGGIATSKYGAAVSSDSTKYMSVAENLLAGNGLVDHRGLPLLSWPPLYPLILAGLSLLSGMDVFVAGWYFNILLLGLNLFLGGMLFRRVFREKPLYAILASLFAALSLSSLRIHATIGADPFYLTLTLAFLLAIDPYITSKSYAAFAWMVVLSMLAPMQRYVGPALGVTAGFVILIENRRSPRVLLRDGLILGILSILPIGWWLGIHNIMTYGTLWGTGSPPSDVWMNVTLALTKMLHWFVPYHPSLMPALTRPLVPLGLLTLVLIFINWKKRENLRAWRDALSVPSTYPAMIHTLVYFAAVALTIVTGDHLDLTSDRYYVILLVPTIIIVLITFDTLLRPHVRLTSRQASCGLALFFAAWSVYPGYSMFKYLADARVQGEPSNYNFYNNRTFHEMAIVAEMQRLRAAEPEAVFYSNYVDAVWFFTRQPANVLPRRSTPIENYVGWPHDRPGYLIWFEPNEYIHLLSPHELSELADLRLVFKDQSGQIYYVQAR